MRAHLSLFVTLLLVCTVAAGAQSTPFESEGGTNRGTPDDITPADETVCDGLKGAAHGLCTAYCEAMDCDSGSPQASQTACDSVSERFQQITGGAPPCGCPCVGRIANYVEALNGDFGLSSCIERVFVPPDVVVFVALNTGLGPVGAQPTFDFGFCGFVLGDFLTITRPQAEQCAALVRQKAAEAGLTCIRF